jgi:hypothetical protein
MEHYELMTGQEVAPEVTGEFFSSGSGVSQQGEGPS